MAKITSDFLRAIAPNTPHAKLDALIEPLNLLLPHYKITNELEVAGFLATACFESDYFRTLHEYGNGKGHEYGKPDPATGLIYYGRGIFQNTWKAAYVDFTRYVLANWKWIQPLCGDIAPPDFVHDPDKLATEFWAVLAACWYWGRNHLAQWAEKGTKGFFGLQGLVNRGSATKEALDYDKRLAIYRKLRRIMPDDFVLGDPIPAPAKSADVISLPAIPDPPNPPESEQPEGGEQPPAGEAAPIVVDKQHMSLSTRLVSVGTVIFGGVMFVKNNLESVYNKAVDSIDGKIIVYAVLSAGLIALGFWLYNNGRKGANDITRDKIAAAADKDSNTVKVQ